MWLIKPQRKRVINKSAPLFWPLCVSLRDELGVITGLRHLLLLPPSHRVYPVVIQEVVLYRKAINFVYEPHKGAAYGQIKALRCSSRGLLDTKRSSCQWHRAQDGWGETGRGKALASSSTPFQHANEAVIYLGCAHLHIIILFKNGIEMDGGFVHIKCDRIVQ